MEQMTEQTKQYRKSLEMTEAELRQLWQANERRAGPCHGDTPQYMAAAMLHRLGCLDKCIAEISQLRSCRGSLGNYWADVLYILRQAKT